MEIKYNLLKPKLAIMSEIKWYFERELNNTELTVGAFDKFTKMLRFHLQVCTVRMEVWGQ